MEDVQTKLGVVLLCGLCIVCHGAMDYTLIPPDADHGGHVDVGLVIFPGAYVDIDRYELLARMVQRTSNSSIWLCMAGGFRFGLPNPSQGREAVNSCIQRLRDSGLPVDSDIYGVGHSLGGVVMNAVGSSHDVIKGMLIWASYLIEGEASSQVKPTLTLSGDLDGQARVTVLAKRFGELLELLQDEPYALLRLPVVVLQGVNHFMFTTDVTSPEVERDDIPSDLNHVIGKSIIAQTSANFIDYHTGASNNIAAAKALIVDHANTSIIVEPLLDMFNIEENVAEKTSPWVSIAQGIMSSLGSEDLKKCDFSTEIFSGDSFRGSRNTVKTTESSLEVEIPVQINHVIISQVQASSYIDAKLKSQMGLEAASENANLGFTFGDPNSCKDVNEKAWERAWNSSSDIARSRFADTGITIEFEEDIEASTGPGWLRADLKFEYKDGVLHIQSTSLNSDDEFLPEGIRNMHYCQLLSPARAIEYIYVDGLKDNVYGE